MVDPIVTTCVAGEIAGFVAALFVARPFSERRKLAAMTRDRDAWRQAYNREVRARLHSIDLNHRWRRIATRAAFKADWLLVNAHFRNPKTGRLLPQGELPPMEIN